MSIFNDIGSTIGDIGQSVGGALEDGLDWLNEYGGKASDIASDVDSILDTLGVNTDAIKTGIDDASESVGEVVNRRITKPAIEQTLRENLPLIAIAGVGLIVLWKVLK